jgi:hypothetical protein
MDSKIPYQEEKLRIVFMFGYAEANTYLLHTNNKAKGTLV